MNINKRIEELNTDLVLQETRIDITLKELKEFSIKTDLQSVKKFSLLLFDLQHLKNEFNCIHTQLMTFTAYQSRS